MKDIESIETAPQLADRDIRQLLEADDDGPCISIYIDTLPAPDAKDKNRIRYKDHVKQAIDQLNARDMEKRTRNPLITQLEQIGTSDDFWIYQQYGLAVLLSPQRTIVRKLLARPGNHALVADQFYLRPALQISHNAHRHHILCLSVDRVELYVGDGRTVHPVALDPGVPTDMSSAIGEPSRVHRVDPDDSGGTDSDQLRRYFERVDQAIWRYHSRDAGLPLLLAALNEYQGLFHEVSGNHNLLEAGVARDPFHDIDEKELASLAWEEVSSAISTRIGDLLERFHSADAHQQGETNLTRIGPAAAHGQIAALLIAADKQVGGRVDPESGRVTLASADPIAGGEVIDGLARLTLRAGGDLWFLPSERMPTNSGAAAIYRFAI